MWIVYNKMNKVNIKVGSIWYLDGEFWYLDEELTDVSDILNILKLF